MSLPGQLREVHFYDTSNLAVLRYAKQHTGGYYVQAVIDEVWSPMAMPRSEKCCIIVEAEREKEMQSAAAGSL